MEDQNQEKSPQDDPFAERSNAERLWHEARLCFGFLTRIPVFSIEYSGHSSLTGACWAFPLVGVCVGLAAALALWLADGFGLASQLAALLAIASMILLTGALHEDGLADTADGFGLGGDTEKRLAAMRDPRIGVFGMVALIVVFSARWTALADLVSISFAEGATAIIAAAAISRGILPYVMHAVANARQDGLSASAGRPESQPALIALGIAAVISLFVFGISGTIVVAIVTAIVTIAIVAIARRLIGGQTGDVLGAIQQVTEAAVLITAAGLVA